MTPPIKQMGIKTNRNIVFKRKVDLRPLLIKSSTSGATSEAGSGNSSAAHEFSPYFIFIGVPIVHVVQLHVFTF
jgi:hypothetical protein